VSDTLGRGAARACRQFPVFSTSATKWNERALAAAAPPAAASAGGGAAAGGAASAADYLMVALSASMLASCLPLSSLWLCIASLSLALPLI